MLDFDRYFRRRADRSSREQLAPILESIRRHHGLTLFPGQILAGETLLSPAIAEMATGEGKTASSLLAIVRAVTSGQRVFVATANDFLARRDADFAEPVLRDFQGTVGCLQGSSTFEARQAAYRRQVVYGTMKEFVFDHLRDRLAPSRPAIQPLAERILIDEADSILIDEAVTPCVISGTSQVFPDAVRHCLAWGARHCDQFTEGSDFLDQSGQGIILTPTGRAKVGGFPLPPEVSPLTLGEIFHWLELSLLVQRRFRRGVHYVVRDGNVLIVDESTGRVAEGRQWGHGIHQAVEAREELKLTPASEPRAIMTIQEYVRRFSRISGMTGTAMEVRHEFRSTFRLRTRIIPLHRPSRRQHAPAITTRTKEDKLQRILEEIHQVHAAGRPILIGTRTIRASQELSERLTDQRLPHVVLNALNPHEEHPIIAEAGQPGRITVATNMAGRGTDIRLLGDSESRGGLHVIGSELHSAARIDRQFAGRSGRQGDPGSFRQFLSMDDDNLTAAYGDELASRIRTRNQKAAPSPNLLYLAQRRIERQAAGRRAEMCRRQSQEVDLLHSLGVDPVLHPVSEF